MLIKIGYDIQLRIPHPTAIVFLLRVHPSRRSDLIADEQFRIEPAISTENYINTDQGRAHAKSRVTLVKVGDTRVSRVTEDLDVQLESLRKAGYPKCRSKPKERT